MNYFESVQPNIENNENLWEPQKEAYKSSIKFFSNIKEDRKEALINLPTGTGKTGLMSILPYGIAKKRVLIITPQTIVRDTVMKSLDSSDHRNFWLFTKTFSNINDLPQVVQYEPKVTIGTLEMADIIILNVHKLQERLESSLVNKVPDDFFDLIIIDEAHHSEAYTWKKAIDFFKFAQVIKLTGTPFRSDGVKITGDRIYKYPLSKAMANGYVKSLEQFEYVPQQMQFTIEGHGEEYTLEQLREMKLKDSDWISRQVALSRESNLSVINKSIELLEIKREKTNNNPHKIVAVACSIKHAYQLQELYIEQGLDTAIVHSDMEKTDLYKEFDKIDTHQVDVVINVALLGEGYDHKFLSIAAIFRPFRSDLPYQQFIGRVLRSIRPTDSEHISYDDNVAQVVHHKELGLEKLWEAYKKEVIKKGIIQEIRIDKRNYPPKDDDNPIESSILETSEHEVITDTFIDTELLRKREHEVQEENEKVKKLMEELQIPEETARSFVLQAKTSQTKQKYLRPDLVQQDLRQQVDKTIKEELIPNILANFELDLKGNELYNYRQSIFPLYTSRMLRHNHDNGACLGIHFSNALIKHVGNKRSNWEIGDFEKGLEEIYEIESFISEKLNTIKGG